MTIRDNSYVQRYVDASVKQLKLSYPTLPDKYLTDFVWRKVSSYIKDQKCEIANSYTGEKSNASLLSILDFVEKKNPIVTGSGSFFMQHSELIAPANDMLKAFRANRTVFKNKAFDCRQAGDMEGYNINNLAQKNEKIKMNSFYGAQGQSASFQYNCACAAATTAQGRSIISTTLWFFEAFLGDDVIFDTIDDIARYIRLIKEEGVNSKAFEFIDYRPSRQDLLNRIFSHYEGSYSQRFEAIVKLMVKNLSDDEVVKVYYKNNLMEFIDKNPKVKDFILAMIRNDEDYPNPYKVPQKLQEAFTTLMPVIDEFIYMKEYIVYNKVYKFETHERSAITYSDTDSVFIYIGNWIFAFLAYLNGWKIEDITMDIAMKDMKLILKIANILTNIIYIEIHRTYDTLTGNAHISEDNRHYINIKNELLMTRYVTYPMKKNYIDLIAVNEGRIIDPPIPEFKGSQLNPKSKNKRVTDRIKKIVSDITLNHDTIDPLAFLKELYEYRDEISQSLTTGGVDFLIPIKVKDAESYANDPESQYRYKSVQTYIYATQDERITLPGSFYSIDVTFGNKDNIAIIKDINPQVYENLMEYVYSNPKLSKNGISYISIPTSLSRVPDWIIPFIDVESITRKHITPLISMIPTFGFNIDTVKTDMYYSTILDL